MIVGDMFVLVVTWMKTAKSYREARRLNIEAPLSTMLIRDGAAVYINIAVMITDCDVHRNILLCVRLIHSLMLVSNAITQGK